MIDDVTLLTIGFFLLAWAILVLLGMKIAGFFHIIGLMVGLFLAFEIFTVTGSAILGMVFAAISLLIGIYGVFVPDSVSR